MNKFKKRITVTLSDETHKKVRTIQSKLIADATTSVSFSRVLEALVKSGIKRQSLRNPQEPLDLV